MTDISSKMGRKPKSLKDRFWKRVTIARADACWPWCGGGGPDEYGRVGIGGDKGKALLAHRVSWEMHNGAIPSGLHVLHRCDNRRCVNPSHLFLGTNADNMADKVAKGRHRSPTGQSNGQAKLSADDVTRIRFRYAEGESQLQIAKSVGVSQTLVSAIVRRKLWADV